MSILESTIRKFAGNGPRLPSDKIEENGYGIFNEMSSIKGKNACQFN